MIYIQLFISFLKVGLFSVGGGYAAMPLIQSEAVIKNSWLTMSEFTDLITIAEMTPGPIAVNSATFVGIRIAGFAGACIATFGCIFPSCIIVSVLSYIYYKYKNMTVMQSLLSSLRPAVVALIASAAISIIKTISINADGAINYTGIILFVSALFVLRKFKPSPILVMVICGAIRLGLGVFLGI